MSIRFDLILTLRLLCVVVLPLMARKPPTTIQNSRQGSNEDQKFIECVEQKARARWKEWHGEY
jgi:hypothetical protein